MGLVNGFMQNFAIDDAKTNGMQNQHETTQSSFYSDCDLSSAMQTDSLRGSFQAHQQQDAVPPLYNDAETPGMPEMEARQVPKIALNFTKWKL